MGSDDIGTIIASAGVPRSLKSWVLDSRLASPAVRISPPKNTKGSVGDLSSRGFGGPSGLGGGLRSSCGLVAAGSIKKYLQLH